MLTVLDLRHLELIFVAFNLWVIHQAAEMLETSRILILDRALEVGDSLMKNFRVHLCFLMAHIGFRIVGLIAMGILLSAEANPATATVIALMLLPHLSCDLAPDLMIWKVLEKKITVVSLYEHSERPSEVSLLESASMEPNLNSNFFNVSNDPLGLLSIVEATSRVLLYLSATVMYPVQAVLVLTATLPIPVLEEHHLKVWKIAATCSLARATISLLVITSLLILLDSPLTLVLGYKVEYSRNMRFLRDSNRSVLASCAAQFALSACGVQLVRELGRRTHANVGVLGYLCYDTIATALELNLLYHQRDTITPPGGEKHFRQEVVVPLLLNEETSSLDSSIKSTPFRRNESLHWAELLDSEAGRLLQMEKSAVSNKECVTRIVLVRRIPTIIPITAEVAAEIEERLQSWWRSYPQESRGRLCELVDASVGVNEKELWLTYEAPGVAYQTFARAVEENVASSEEVVRATSHAVGSLFYPDVADSGHGSLDPNTSILVNVEGDPDVVFLDWGLHRVGDLIGHEHSFATREEIRDLRASLKEGIAPFCRLFESQVNNKSPSFNSGLRWGSPEDICSALYHKQVQSAPGQRDTYFLGLAYWCLATCVAEGSAFPSPYNHLLDDRTVLSAVCRGKLRPNLGNFRGYPAPYSSLEFMGLCRICFRENPNSRPSPKLVDQLFNEQYDVSTGDQVTSDPCSLDRLVSSEELATSVI